MPALREKCAERDYGKDEKNFYSESLAACVFKLKVASVLSVNILRVITYVHSVHLALRERSSAIDNIISLNGGLLHLLTQRL